MLVKLKADKLIFVFSLVAIYAFAWVLQNHFLLNSDVGFLAYCTQRLLQGGHYASDFLETNPPLILYLYVPCVWLMKSLSLMMALRVYVYLLATLSFMLCAYFLRDILQDKLMKLFFLVSLGFVFLCLPLSEFGQREHLTLMLVMPYLFLVSARLENPKAHYTYAALVAGLMAGLGFGLKPFFFGAYGLVELYYCFQKRSLLACLRKENFALAAVISLYLLVIVLYHQAYLKIILPLIVPVYYTWFTSKFSAILLLHTSFFTYFTVAFYLVFYPYFQKKNLSNIICLAAIGFWLAFVLQRIDWYYHEFPYFALNGLLLVLGFCQLVSVPSNKAMQLKMLGFSLAIASYIYFFEGYVYSVTSFPFYPQGFFSLLTFVALCVTAFLFKNHFQKAILSSGIVSLAVYCFYVYLTHSPWEPHKVVLIFAMYFLLMAYVLPHDNFKILAKNLLLLVLGLCLFTYPFYRITLVSRYSAEFKHLYQQLIARMQPYQQHTTYYFTNESELTYPLIYYTQQRLFSRFWSLMWLPALREPDHFEAYSNFYKTNVSQLDYYIGNIMEDFQKHKPEYVFVDDRVNSKQVFYGATPPDYLKLFSMNTAFSAAWKSYEFVETIDLPPLCRIKVYKEKA